MPDLAKLDYVDRVNRAIDHVLDHLDQSLKLEAVAGVAGFSPYHFHRIFQGLVGETLHDFVNRVRLERSVHLIVHGGQMSLTDIALACGFSSSSSFSRAFRDRFGVAPRSFDVEAFRRAGRGRLVESLAHPDRLIALPHASNRDRFTVHLRDLPQRRVAYLRVFRPYEGDRVRTAIRRLIDWATERKLAGGQWLGYQWEDPTIVPLELCRYDVGLEIPADAKADGEVSTTVLPPMRVAEVAIAGSIELELEALEWLYSTWLPRSRYVPDHQPGFEAWVGMPFAHGETHFEVRLQIPVMEMTSAP